MVPLESLGETNGATTFKVIKLKNKTLLQQKLLF